MTQIAYSGLFGTQFLVSRDLFTVLTAGKATVRTFLPRLLTAASRIQNCTYRKIITCQTPQSNLPLSCRGKIHSFNPWGIIFFTLLIQLLHPFPADPSLFRHGCITNTLFQWPNTSEYICWILKVCHINRLRQKNIHYINNIFSITKQKTNAWPRRNSMSIMVWKKM